MDHLPDFLRARFLQRGSRTHGLSRKPCRWFQASGHVAYWMLVNRAPHVFTKTCLSLATRTAPADVHLKHLHVCIYVYIDATHTQASTRTQHTYTVIYIHIYIYIHKYIYIYIYTYMYVICVCVCTRICMHACLNLHHACNDKHPLAVHQQNRAFSACYHAACCK